MCSNTHPHIHTSILTYQLLSRPHTYPHIPPTYLTTYIPMWKSSTKPHVHTTLLYVHIYTHTSPIHSYTICTHTNTIYLYSYYPLSQSLHTIYSYVKIHIFPSRPQTHTHTWCTNLYILLIHTFHILRHICYTHVNIPMCMTHTQSWFHQATYTYHLFINRHRLYFPTHPCISKCHICHTHIKYTCHPQHLSLSQKEFCYRSNPDCIPLGPTVDIILWPQITLCIGILWLLLQTPFCSSCTVLQQYYLCGKNG